MINTRNMETLPESYPSALLSNDRTSWASVEATLLSATTFPSPSEKRTWGRFALQSMGYTPCLIVRFGDDVKLKKI